MDESDGRRVAFRGIYEACYRPITAYARRRVDEYDADDVVAETFLVAWRRIEDVPRGDLTLPWLYGVARRVISQGRRSGWRRDRLAARLGGLIRPEEAVTSETDRLDERQVVHLALARLRPRDQELLRLAEWEGLAPAELAHVFHCSTNAIAIRLHRAHRQFKQALDSVDEESERATQRETSR